MIGSAVIIAGGCAGGGGGGGGCEGGAGCGSAFLGVGTFVFLGVLSLFPGDLGASYFLGRNVGMEEEHELRFYFSMFFRHEFGKQFGRTTRNTFCLDLLLF
jgi:hypothetical protein